MSYWINFINARIPGLTSQSFNYWQIVFTIIVANFVILFLVFVKYVYSRHQYSKHIPGKKVKPFNLLGNIGDMQTLKDGIGFNVSLLQLIGAYTQLFGKSKLFCIWVSYVPFILIVKAQGVEEVVANSKLAKKGWSYNFLHPWLGTGLLTSHGQKWKSRRKLLTPSFHFEILKDFLPIFNEQAQTFAKILQNETTKEYTNIVMPVTLCSLDIICETTLGVSVGAQENKDSEYVKAIGRVSDITAERMLNPRYWSDFMFSFTEAGKQQKADIKLLHEFTRSVIRKKKELLESGGPVENRKRKALMDVLLEHHLKTKELSEEDIREEVDTFAFEGHDTTSMGMSWALYLIGLYKHVQEKVHEELDRIFGDDTERPITVDDLKDMNYLECVLKESQRLYPSVPFFAREATEEVKICGFIVPKGTQMTVITYYLHRDEEMFPNPETFDPDRFLPENSYGRHPYAYIPFSAGPRNCIGQRFALMEEKVVVANVLRHFHLESLDQRDQLIPSAELILRSPNPIRIKIRLRHK